MFGLATQRNWVKLVSKYLSVIELLLGYMTDVNETLYAEGPTQCDGYQRDVVDTFLRHLNFGPLHALHSNF